MTGTGYVHIGGDCTRDAGRVLWLNPGLAKGHNHTS